MPGIYDELKEIAAERSSEKRVRLLHKITDLFLEAGGARTDAENYLFNDIMEKIVDQISHEAKIHVATHLATLPGFPAQVARHFARHGDIEIARPVLRSSPALDDNDLVGIAMTGEQDRLHAIATRDILSPKVTDVLIDRGDRQVVHRVSANHGAQFSNWGFEQLVAKARKDVNLQELLIDRPDLAQVTVDSLLPLMSEALALKLAERGFDVGNSVSPDILRIARERFAEAVRNRKANIRGVAALAELVSCGDLTPDEAVNELVDDGRLLDVASLLTRFAKLDTNDVFGILTRGQLQLLMLLFRALELKWSTLEGLLALRAQKLRMSNPASAEVARDYDAIDKALAQRTIRFLQVRYRLTGSPLDAPEPALVSA